MKKSIYILLISSFWVGLVFTNVSYAQKEGTVGMEVLSYDELMNLLVVTASKEEQKITDAPAIIDVITERQIKDFGVTDLYELLSFLPGVESIETFFGRTVLNFRGVKNYNYTNKVLLMINGTPLTEPVTGSYFLENIPVSSVSRIEIIRGPGSALYGTNAFSGVINIITKKGTGESEKAISVGYGSYKTMTAELSGNIETGKDAGLFVSASVGSSDGYSYDIKADERGRSKSIDYFYKPIKAYLNYTAGDFFAEAGFGKFKKALYGLTPNIDYIGETNLQNIFANAQYSFSLSSSATALFKIRFLQFDNPSTNIGYFPVKGYPGHAESTVELVASGNVIGSELQFNIKLSDAITNVSGVVFESYKTDPYLFKYTTDGAISPFSAYVNSYSSNNFAGYSQFNIKASDIFSFVAGIRVVKDKDISDVFFSPRTGMIIKLSKDYFVKVLYGQAFRSPTFFEKYASTKNVLFGSTNLKAEKISTLDVGLEGELNKNTKFRLNGFYELTSDEISRVPTSKPAEHGATAAMYVNSGQLKVFGAEFNVNGIIEDHAYYGLNFSWKGGKTEFNNAETDVMGIAKITANGWFSYRYDRFSFTPQFQYIGSREGKSSRLVSGKAFGPYKIDGFFLLNLSVGATVSQFNLTASIKNIFNTKYAYPEYIRERTEETPGGPGTNFMLMVKYNF